MTAAVLAIAVVVAVWIAGFCGLSRRQRVKQRLVQVTATGPQPRPGQTSKRNGWRPFKNHKAARHQRLVATGLEPALDALVRASRAGLGLELALAEAASTVGGPAGDELHRVVADMHRGMRPDDALAGFADRASSAESRLVVAALGISHRLGAPPSVALLGVRQSLRQRRRLALEVRALVSQARASMAVMVGLPVAFLLMTTASDPASLNATISDPLRRLCLVVGLGLDGLGWWWMRTLIRRLS